MSLSIRDIQEKKTKSEKISVLTAFATASAVSNWYEPNGMSATISEFFDPLTTLRQKN